MATKKKRARPVRERDEDDSGNSTGQFLDLSHTSGTQLLRSVAAVYELWYGKYNPESRHNAATGEKHPEWRRPGSGHWITMELSIKELLDTIKAEWARRTGRRVAEYPWCDGITLFKWETYRKINWPGKRRFCLANGISFECNIVGELALPSEIDPSADLVIQRSLNPRKVQENASPP